MISVRKDRKQEGKRVRFVLPEGVEAEGASVVGDFNDWDPKATPMKRDRSGRWAASVVLPAGKRFEFRYRVLRSVEGDVNDAGWANDDHCECCANAFGGENSVLST